MYNRVLVTGGSGFVGNSLKNIRPNWIYVSSKDCDLTAKEEVSLLFNKVKPDAIVHLAGKVGGIKENSRKQGEFYYTNVAINTNVINEAKNAGINRVLSSLSTCSFPNKVSKYPFSEDDIFNGPPAETNLSYGFAKRALFVQSNAYRKQYGVNYSCFSPSNLYGPGDNFEDDSSHFIGALVRKIAEAKDGDTVEMWGTGNALRQQLYIDDLVAIIPLLLDKHNTESPLIVAPRENLSIRHMAECCVGISHKKINLYFNGDLDGQYRKDGSNKELLSVIGNFCFTSFKDGIKKTYNAYNTGK
jgi:GDP-L-fucose synthase